MYTTASAVSALCGLRNYLNLAVVREKIDQGIPYKDQFFGASIQVEFEGSQAVVQMTWDSTNITTRVERHRLDRAQREEMLQQLSNRHGIQIELTEP